MTRPKTSLTSLDFEKRRLLADLAHVAAEMDKAHEARDVLVVRARAEEIPRELVAQAGHLSTNGVDKLVKRRREGERILNPPSNRG